MCGSSRCCWVTPSLAPRRVMPMTAVETHLLRFHLSGTLLAGLVLVLSMALVF